MIRKTGRKVLSFLLALAMIVGLVPGTSLTALADESYQLWIGGQQVTSSNLSGEGWSYDPQLNVLRLINYNDVGVHKITYNNDTYYSSICAFQSLTVELVGTSNTISNNYEPDKQVYSVYVAGDLSIIGEGKLTVTSDANGGVECGGSLTVESGTVNVTSGSPFYNAVHANNILVTNGFVTADSRLKTGIYADNEIQIKNGTVCASGAHGIQTSSGDVVISGGTVEASGSVNAGDGIRVAHDLIVSGGNVTASGQNGCYIENKLKIDGGAVTVANASSTGDGVYCFLDAQISGGTVCINGGKRGLCVSRGETTISGGVVNATGIDNGLVTVFSNLTISGGSVTAYGGVRALFLGGDFTLGSDISVKAGESEEEASYIDNLDSWQNPEKWVFLKGYVHSHNFSYAVDKNTITATCTEGRCTLPTVDGVPTATLTIEAPAADDGEAVVKASPEDVFGDLSGMVRYQTKTGATWGEETTVAPTAAGIHRASITLGDATASVSYGMNCIAYATGIANGSVVGAASATCGSTVTLAVTPDAGYQLDTLTVTPEAGSGIGDVVVDGNTFVMPEASVTVSATFRQITYSVAVDGGKATVTDSTPEQHAYTAEIMGIPEDKTYDGESIDLSATVQKSEGFPSQVPVGDVSFEFGGEEVTHALGVGTYTASATVGDKTISKSLTIHGQTPDITYCTGIAKVGNFIIVSLFRTNEYIPLASNPSGITLLMDGRTYVVRGNIDVGALVVVGNPKLVLCNGARLNVYAGIYHIGSSLEIYNEKDAEDSVLTIEGSRLLSDLDNYDEVVERYGAIAGEGSSLSGAIRINGGNVAAEKGVNGRLFADDFSLTHGPGVTAKGSKAGFELANLTGGTEDGEGFVTYDSASLSELTKLVVEQKPFATVSAAPVARGLTYSGMAQKLVTAGEASGGTMQYALGNADSAPAEGWGEGIPTAIADGTYHVWYRVVGDADHIDSEPVCVEVTIGRAAWQDTDAVLLSANVTLSGKLEMNYYLSVPDAVAGGAKVVMDGPEGVVEKE